jgi:hypothetical protein
MTTLDHRQETADSRHYLTEHIDRLPFGSTEKARRYATERYHDPTDLNWYTCDPSFQFLMCYDMTPEDYAWAEAHLVALDPRTREALSLRGRTRHVSDRASVSAARCRPRG